MMGFMTAYKRLDNLCKDMNGAGVSGYIEDMENMKVEIFSALEWKDDYDKLKRYRYIRNRIAHDNDADEDTLCTPKATPKGGAHGWQIAASVILIVFVIALIIYLF